MLVVVSGIFCSSSALRQICNRTVQLVVPGGKYGFLRDTFCPKLPLQDSVLKECHLQTLDCGNRHFNLSFQWSLILTSALSMLIPLSANSFCSSSQGKACVFSLCLTKQHSHHRWVIRPLAQWQSTIFAFRGPQDLSLSTPIHRTLENKARKNCFCYWGS